MKFDFIVGNPPYQDSSTTGSNKKLWKDITVKMFNLSNNISLVTPVTALGVIQKHGNVKTIDYTTDKYFDVGVEIFSWNISYCGSCQVTHKDDTISTAYNNTEMIEKERSIGYLMFERMKKTPIKTRQFKRAKVIPETPAGDKVIKNENKNTFCFVEDIQLKNDIKIVTSISQGLSKENIKITKDNYGDLYVFCKSTTKDQTVIDTLLHPYFQKICNSFRKVYGTGFNNVLIYVQTITESPTESPTEESIQKLFGMSKDEIEWLSRF